MTDQSNLLVAYVSQHERYVAIREKIVNDGAQAARNLRKDAKRSLRKFAAQIGVTPSYLSKIENGHIPLPADLAHRMLNAVR